MRRKSNPYIKQYKKLHREKVKRKNAIKKLPETFSKFHTVLQKLNEISRRYGVSMQYFSNVLREIFDKRIG